MRKKILTLLVVGSLLWIVQGIIGCGRNIKFKCPYTPSGLTWDGKNIWGCEWFFREKNIYKHNIADGSVIAIYDHPGAATGLAWDGHNLWSCDAEIGRIYKHNMDETLSISGSYKSPSTSPTGLTWDGKNLWSCDAESDKIYKHNMDETLSVAEVYDSPSNIPSGLAWDGYNLWSCNGGVRTSFHTRETEQGPLRIYKHNMDSTLSVSKTYRADYSKFGIQFLNGLTWDGTNIWIGGKGPYVGDVIIKTDYK